ncbi:MAG: radical SAM protein [Chloroflexi bacterium]|nr:radical SAM protein [Chloroflexota bacterium]MCI0889292.1 radical SAM protein [Chloroflexota bacterium]
MLRLRRPNFALYDAREFLRRPPYPGTKVTLKRLLNLYLVRFQRMRAHEKLLGYPLMLTIEAANVCNLACPGCFTGVGDVSRTKGHFPMPLYERIMDELGDYLFQVELHNWGEPLLNKNIPDLIRIATDKGIGTTISTNFSFPFNEERAEALVASGLTTLGVSLDGASQETYEQYRVNGNLDKALENVRRINEAKRKLGSSTPRLIWEFHVFGHNVDDIERAQEMAVELDMEIDVSKGWVVGEEWDPDGPYKFFQAPWVDACEFLWQRAVINIDSGVAPCCGTFFREDDFATVENQSFKEAWNSKKFQLARKMFTARDGSAEAKALVCYECPETITREEYITHMASGGARHDFRGRFTSNDGFNYFFSRKAGGAKATDLAHAIPLEETTSHTSASDDSS